MAHTGGDALGVDWRIPLDVAREIAGDRAVQGNLEPALLIGPWERVEAAALDVLGRGGGTGHVFNLGHGVLPQTDPDVITRLTEFVQDQTS
jgi:uroporphyrinogen decarboxylase